MQEERDRRHMQKQREKEGKSTRFQPPPSLTTHSDLPRKKKNLVNLKISTYLSFV